MAPSASPVRATRRLLGVGGVRVFGFLGWDFGGLGFWVLGVGVWGVRDLEFGVWGVRGVGLGGLGFLGSGSGGLGMWCYDVGLGF